jgi:hypothetical protein
MKRRNVILFAMLLGVFAAAWFSAVPAQAAEKAQKETDAVVAEGKSVKVHYTLTVDGKVVDSSNKRECDFIRYATGRIRCRMVFRSTGPGC